MVFYHPWRHRHVYDFLHHSKINYRVFYRSLTLKSNYHGINARKDRPGHTGSSRGIGFYTALGLARLGADVIVVSHNDAHCSDAIMRINTIIDRDAARYYVADLESQRSIRQLADHIKRDLPRLDVLINNAGGWFREYQETPDQIEMTFALNHLGYFLLTGLLLDLLKKSASARIINVTSIAHRQPKTIQFENINLEGEYSAFKAYSQSKLANVLFTKALARRLLGKEITVNAVHPGLVASYFYRNFGFLTPIANRFITWAGKDSEEGAQTSSYLAGSPKVVTISGKYFVNKNQHKSSKPSNDIQMQEHLWQLSERLTGFNYPD